MNQIQLIGWGLIAAAGVVAVIVAGYLFVFSRLTNTEAAAMFVGLLVPLGIQAFFGWMILQRGSYPKD